MENSPHLCTGLPSGIYPSLWPIYGQFTGEVLNILRQLDGVQSWKMLEVGKPEIRSSYIFYHAWKSISSGFLSKRADILDWDEVSTSSHLFAFRRWKTCQRWLSHHQIRNSHQRNTAEISCQWARLARRPQAGTSLAMMWTRNAECCAVGIHQIWFGVLAKKRVI